MKVLFIFGGMPHYLQRMLNLLNQQHDISVSVVIPEQTVVVGKGVKQEKDGNNFKVIYTQEYSAYYKKPFLKGLKNIFKSEKPDFIIIGWPYILGLIFYPQILIWLKLNHIKIVLREIPFQVPKKGEAIKYYKENPIYDEQMNYPKTKGIGFYINTFILQIVRQLYYKAVDATMNYTESGKELQMSYGVNSSNIYTTYNSPDTDLLYLAKEQIKIEPTLMQPNNYRLIHVGRLVAWKKVDLLIKAFSIVNKNFPSSELIIIGDGPQEDELKRLSKKFNLLDNVKFVGGVYNNVVLGKYFTESTIYVLAGMGGLSINEAMLFGKPIICSVCDGSEKHLVYDQINGLYFKDSNENDLAEKIIFLFERPELIRSMGLESEKIIRNKVNINTVVSAFSEAFKKINI